MVDQLEERIERDARFTSDVSHELRSPLTTLAASLEVLESGRDDLPERAGQAVGLMAGDVRRFQRLVADLLEISRFDASSDDLHLDEVLAGELVRQAVMAAARTIPDVIVPVIEVTSEADAAWLLVDKRRIERIIGNLLENAQLYAGGATLVRVSVGGDPPEVVIEVVDAGPGLKMSERTRVFERFYRGETSGRRGANEGSGLGLALVAEHVRRLDGTIEVTDGPRDTGTSFVVRLPVAEEPT